MSNYELLIITNKGLLGCIGPQSYKLWKLECDTAALGKWKIQVWHGVLVRKEIQATQK